MAKLKLLALTNAVPGREADFEAWYDEQHLSDILSLKGVKSAQRYKLVAKLNGADQGANLALYDVECDDPAALLAEMGEVAASGRMAMTDAMDEAIGYAGLFLEHGEPRTN